MVFMDNWGKLMANIFIVPTTSGATFLLKDLNNNTQTCVTYKDRDFDDHWNQLASQSFAQVGKGTAPVTRQDFKIEVPFTNGGAEDNLKITSLFGYNSALGKITISTSISPTAGSGTITEVVKVNSIQNLTAGLFQFLVTRDLVSPVNFISGKSINIEHEILI